VGASSNTLPDRGAAARSVAPETPTLLPRIHLARGLIVVPSDPESPPVPAVDGSGEPVDVFDVADSLFRQYPGIYVVDLDGVLHGRPQFDLLQEIPHGHEMWVEAGPRSVDQVMDVLVAGGTMAVVPAATDRAWREIPSILQITDRFVVEVPSPGPRALGAPDPLDPRIRTRQAFALRVPGVMLSAPETGVDWGLVRELAPTGPVYVNGGFAPEEGPRLTEAGARGGIFEPRDLFEQWKT
jgi:hypothetical protein